MVPFFRLRVFVAILFSGVVAAMGVGAAPSASAQDESGSCSTGLVASGRDTAPLIDAVAVVLDDVDALFASIEARDDFGAGWLDDGQVGEATQTLRDDLAAMAGAAATILESRGWVLDTDWQVPANELPISPEVSLIEEIWNTGQFAFEQNLTDLAALDTRDTVIEFWTRGASPCGTAATVADFVNSLPTSLPPVQGQELADTGSNSVRFAVVGLSLFAAGVLLIMGDQRHARP